MDLPIALEMKRTVSGKEELEQVMFICLSQQFGTILHDGNKGTKIAVHTRDYTKLRMGATVTLNAIEGVQVEQILADDDYIQIIYNYNGNIEKYNYYLG